MNDEALLRYSRHISLKDFDIAGQENVCRSRVLIVGAGGLGCPAAMYLAASGVGHVVVADNDRVELSNLQRQIAHTTGDVGREKVYSLADKLLAINPLIVVEPLAVRLQGELLREQVKLADVVLDCSDNFATRHAVNRACVQHGRPLISGAAIRSEAQLAVFNYRAGSPCYACLYGETQGEDALTCSESGVFAPLVGIVGAMQAAEALKLLSGYGEVIDAKLLVLDVSNMDWRVLKMQKDSACVVCGDANH